MNLKVKPLHPTMKSPAPAISRTATLFKPVFKALSRILGRLRILWMLLLASLLLSGCVNYDVAVNFDGQHRGAIVQHIKLGERLTSFSGSTAQQWLDSLERRARRLQGKTRRISNQEMMVTIPFNNGAELETKFNQFFNPTSKQGAKAVNDLEPGLPEIKSHLNLGQSNLLLLQRNWLSYDLDLRSLGTLSADGNRLLSPGALLELEFSLKTPWGARSVKTANALAPETYQKGRQLVWRLLPGQQNHLEAVFWLPSPLGVGAIAIALLVAAGIYLRYQVLPAPATGTTQSVLPEGQ